MTKPFECRFSSETVAEHEYEGLAHVFPDLTPECTFILRLQHGGGGIFAELTVDDDGEDWLVFDETDDDGDRIRFSMCYTGAACHFGIDVMDGTEVEVSCRVLKP